MEISRTLLILAQQNIAFSDRHPTRTERRARNIRRDFYSDLCDSLTSSQVVPATFQPRGIRVGFEHLPSVFIEARYLDREKLADWAYDFLDIRALFPREIGGIIMGWVYVKPHERDGARLYTFVEWLKCQDKRG